MARRVLERASRFPGEFTIGDTVDVVYRLGRNSYGGGENLQLTILDLQQMSRSRARLGGTRAPILTPVRAPRCGLDRASERSRRLSWSRHRPPSVVRHEPGRRVRLPVGRLRPRARPVLVLARGRDSPGAGGDGSPARRALATCCGSR